jgi:hypothetical protein
MLWVAAWNPEWIRNRYMCSRSTWHLAIWRVPRGSGQVATLAFITTSDLFTGFFLFRSSLTKHLVGQYRKLRARDQYISRTLIGGKGGAGPSSLPTMLEGPMEYICKCKMDVKSTWVPTWHPWDHVPWSLGLFSKTTWKEVGLSQNRETMAFWMLTTVDLFYLIVCEDPHE